MSSERAEDRHGDVTAHATPAEGLVHRAARDAGFSGELIYVHLAPEQRIVQPVRIESARANVVQRFSKIFRDCRLRGDAGCGRHQHGLHIMHSGIVDVYGRTCKRLQSRQALAVSSSAIYEKLRNDGERSRTETWVTWLRHQQDGSARRHFRASRWEQKDHAERLEPRLRRRALGRARVRPHATLRTLRPMATRAHADAHDARARKKRHRKWHNTGFPDREIPKVRAHGSHGSRPPVILSPTG
jgi:hypothetical protein